MKKEREKVYNQDILDYFHSLFECWNYMAEKDPALSEIDIAEEELEFSYMYEQLRKRLKILAILQDHLRLETAPMHLDNEEDLAMFKLTGLYNDADNKDFFDIKEWMKENE